MSDGPSFPDPGSLTGRRLVAIFAHPDDEAYSAGGTLALCARAGAEVTVVCLTRGESAACRDRALATTAEIAELRGRELAASCRTLGIAPPRLFDLPDGALEAHRAIAERTVEALLAELQPEVVITSGVDGVYGHRDHLATTGAVSGAVGALGSSPRPRLLHTVFPPGLFGPVLRGVRRFRRELIAVGIAPGDLGVRADQVELRIGLGAAREIKLQALAAHRCQLRGGDPHTFLRPGLIDRLLDEEWFARAAGPPLPPDPTHPFSGL